MNLLPPSKTLRLGAVAFLAAIFVAGIFFWRSEKQLPSAEKKVVVVALKNNFNAAAPSPVPYAAFQKKPFAVIEQTVNYSWTTNDGRQPQFIRQLAHNEFEYARMVQENDTIYRRQLVYHKQTLSALTQHAMQSGEPIRELTVPGLDGQEFQVEVRNLEIAEGGNSGTFSGHILGKPDSMVTFAFKNGREAFTVVSLAEKIFLSAEPREPGELVVKQFDPVKYGGGNLSCGVE